MLTIKLDPHPEFSIIKCNKATWNYPARRKRGYRISTVKEGAQLGESFFGWLAGTSGSPKKSKRSIADLAISNSKYAPIKSDMRRGAHMRHLYRLLLIFSSISLAFAIFLVNNGVSFLGNLNTWALKNLPNMPLIEWSPPIALLAAMSYFTYFLGCLILSSIGFRATRQLSSERVDSAKFKSIELANDTFLPIYLAYFFVALSIESYLSFTIIFGIVLLFVYRSGGVYFDPIYVLRGYKIYAATSSTNVKSYFITKQILKGAEDLKFEGLRRVNDFTFIEIGGGE